MSESVSRVRLLSVFILPGSGKVRKRKESRGEFHTCPQRVFSPLPPPSPLMLLPEVRKGKCKGDWQPAYSGAFLKRARISPQAGAVEGTACGGRRG
jgi:hypothetical protein